MNHDSCETSFGSFCFKPAYDDRQAPHLHIVGRKAPKATDLQHRIKKGLGLFVIDVRDATDIAQAGAISDAVNFSLLRRPNHVAPETGFDFFFTGR